MRRNINITIVYMVVINLIQQRVIKKNLIMMRKKLMML